MSDALLGTLLVLLAWSAILNLALVHFWQSALRRERELHAALDQMFEDDEATALDSPQQ